MSAGKRYRRQLAVAAAVVAVERIWPALWPVFAVIGGFLSLALLDLLPRLPGWLHLAVLAGFAAALLVAAARAVRSFTPVDRADARRRLEHDSGLGHRPLQSLDDGLAAGHDDPVAEALWQRHRAAAAAALDALRLQPPAPDTARRDPRALRVLVVLAVTIGLAAGAAEPGARLARAVSPGIGGGPAEPVVIDLWITPPAYTRSAPLNLRQVAGGSAGTGGETAAVADVPAGSTILAQVHGIDAAPALRIGATAIGFEALGAAAQPANRDGTPSWRAEAVASAGTRLEVLAGRRLLAAWPIRIVADQPPAIAFAAPPQPTPAALLLLRYQGGDDYGIAAVAAVVAHADGRSDLDGAVELRLDLAVTEAAGGRAGDREVAGRQLLDLTAHAWAGEPVTLVLEAVDAAGQTGRSDVVALTLPERTFSHPVAQAVIAERKRLVDASPPVRELVSNGLAGIAGRPDQFGHDSVVSLALAVAASRLRHDRSPQVTGPVREILWQTALRLEQGVLPVAEQRLREARERLIEALRGDAGSEEIERLIDEVEAALEAYLQALAADLARQGGAERPVPPGSEVVSDQDLRDLLDAARELARAGARDSARQLLSELQRLLDQMRGGFANPAETAEMREAQRLLEDIRDLAARQQSLLDQTFEALRQQREGGRRQPPGAGAASGDAAAAAQEVLRRDLGEVMRRFEELMGGIPLPLGEAERLMKGAGEALSAGRPGEAVPAQGTAVEKLQAAGQQAGAMMGQRFGAGAGMVPGGMGGGDGGTDPFGRRGSEGKRGLDAGTVAIPDRMELRRVEEILRELRRRAGEAARPERELDYIERLLRRF